MRNFMHVRLLSDLQYVLLCILELAFGDCCACTPQCTTNATLQQQCSWGIATQHIWLGPVFNHSTLCHYADEQLKWQPWGPALQIGP
jgi:hypothetical protein